MKSPEITAYAGVADAAPSPSFLRGLAKPFFIVTSAALAAWFVNENIALMSGHSNSVVIGGGVLERDAIPDDVPPCTSPASALFFGNHLMGHTTTFTLGRGPAGRVAEWKCLLPGCDYNFTTVG